MTAAVDHRLYHSDLVYEFQVQGVVDAYSSHSKLAVWDTGLGKTHLAMMLAAILFEDDLIDLVMVACEQDKVPEWVDDFGTFTELRVVRYHGTLKKRQRLRDTLDDHQVLVSTFETWKNDCAVSRGKRKKPVPGVFLQRVLGKRVLVVWDEMTKLSNRSSGNHKAHALIAETLPDCRMLGLTATPMERSPEGYYNLGRILCPEDVGTVASFDEQHVKTRDAFGEPSRFKNLGPDSHIEPWHMTLRDKMAGVVMLKRKTDSDVVDQFPEQVEEWTHVSLDKRHLDFYETVRDTFDTDDPMVQRQVFTVLRQIAGAPESLLGSQGKVAKTIVESVGEAGLRALGAAKADRLLSDLETVVHGQGAQAVVFTFFGQSILPWLAGVLEAGGFSVAQNHGTMSPSQREASKATFREGRAQVFLSSDAGSKGINLQSASYVFNYEMTLTHANYIQRINRIHRIDSTHEIVVARTYVSLDTVEDGIINLGIRRNLWSDDLLSDEEGGENFLTAEQRRKIIDYSRKREKEAA